MGDILVAKIGGSTLGDSDTTLADVVELQRRGIQPVIVHGGGALISEWLVRHNLPTRFENGLRVTDPETLQVVVAVLAGLVNKQIVSALTVLGVNAVGLSGADGGLLRARALDEKLGAVGEVISVEPRTVLRLVEDGVIPVIAPVGQAWEGERPTGELLNINADTAAGAIAIALKARWLVFLTDVQGVRGAAGDTLTRLRTEDARSLVASGVVEGGMIPKVEACVRAAQSGCVSVVADGRRERSLLSVAEGRPAGTVVF